MPEPTTVWEVDLVRGALRERRGSLSLGSDALVFRPEGDGAAERRIPLAAIARVRRLRASPVLLVRHAAGAASLETAFYFVEPPALGPVAGEAAPRFGTGKRRTRRKGVLHLTGANRQLRHDLRAWERDVREAMGRHGAAER